MTNCGRLQHSRQRASKANHDDQGPNYDQIRIKSSWRGELERHYVEEEQDWGEADGSRSPMQEPGVQHPAPAALGYCAAEEGSAAQCCFVTASPWVIVAGGRPRQSGCGE